jgi:hypothetical protein
MDENQETAWDEINPPMASVPRQGLPCKSSADDARTVFRNELTACLTLAAPVGMNEEARRDWFAVAWDTLKDIPPDDLARAARMARQTCDHPSKIVPAIVAEAESQMRRWRSIDEAVGRPTQPQLESPDTIRCTPEDARQILNEFGIKRNWAA